MISRKSKDKKMKYPAPGKLVNVNWHEMHVYSEGQGEKTFVFMAGNGTPCPTIDFKPLWSLLSDSNRIAVVEKAGYGWSETTQTSRDLDTVLEESRKALRRAKIDGPYYLVAHSLSGLEAIYWAQKYPEEVKAIIGLDTGVPEVYGVMKRPPLLVFKALSFLSGLSVNDESTSATCKKHFPSFESASLTDDDRAMYMDAFRHKAFSSDMINEMKCMKEYANAVTALPLPTDTPIYFVISNWGGKPANGIKPEEWAKMLKDFLSSFKNAKYLELNCGHYVHSCEPAIIADEINAFLNEPLLK